MGDPAAARARRETAGSVGSRLGHRPARRAGRGARHCGRHRLLHREFPQACSADACSVTGYPAFEQVAADSEAVSWQEIVPRGLVTGDARHAFKVSSGRRYTHVRLNIFPDGGVARLRVHGEVVPDPAMLEGLTVDLAPLGNGADVAAGSDRNDFSAPRNVISPGLSRVMGEGWETRRRRRPGHEWLVIRLAGHGVINLAYIDPSWYRGNQPDS